MKVCKFILGVNKRCTYAAIMCKVVDVIILLNDILYIIKYICIHFLITCDKLNATGTLYKNNLFEIN